MKACSSLGFASSKVLNLIRITKAFALVSPREVTERRVTEPACPLQGFSSHKTGLSLARLPTLMDFLAF
jgi:hypothetical protein